MSRDELAGAAAKQAAYTAAGAALGAVTQHASKPGSGGQNPIALQIGSAMGAAAAGGAGVGGTLAAGAGVVTAKVAAGVALATAAAPFVVGAALIGAVGFGIFKLFDSSES
jgi:hypothetical protein